MLDSDPLLSRSRIRLQTIVRLRWVAVVGQLLAIVLVHFGLGFRLPLVLCLAIIATSATLNMVLRVLFPMRHRFSNAAATSLLAYDIMQLAFLLYLTGGIANPFVFLLVAPVTVSAASLPARNTIVLGAMAMGVTLMLISYHAPLPWREGEEFALPTLYTLGIAASVASGMLFLALYAARLSKEAQQMTEALAATELVLAREQKLHALDGLAAAAAHELGTPLSTITLVAKEIERELPPGSPLADDAALLKSQADRCREILRKLTRRPSESDPLHSRLSVSVLIEEAVSPHRGFGVDIETSSGPLPGVTGKPADEPVLTRLPGIVFGIGNLIENAVEFAETRVEVASRWNGELIDLTVTDDGPGFSASVIGRLGDPFVTGRPFGERDPDARSGLGLGFFIAKTLLERSGAQVEFANRGDNKTGAVVRVVWRREAVEVGQAKAVHAQ
ncbi:MAG: ActS/PrrB/RegB family redox-sensitive histidine kinase [Hyphomicrobiaceae bacterium]|nr:MAG: ActS/PrrB/RegB family redox-sensitive histidine kinase [Hyphomicrobiaceae bacterium]